ncbi:MAG TPA: HAMP domain-containing sensor histidine kinase [Solimonas sp.]|nr:HAMP domain-containing sensor histidine kinase [Solimonas sp.]
MLRSLRTRLLGFWLLSAVTCVALAAVMLHLHGQIKAQQLAQARARIELACAHIAIDFQRAERDGGNVAALLQSVLRNYDGVDGGVWRERAGFFAYAFPSHQGGEAALAASDKPLIQALARKAIDSGRQATEVQPSGREAALIHACAAEANPPAAAWTRTRIALAPASAYDSVLLGLAILLAFVLVAALLLGRVIATWTGKLDKVESALADYPLESFPQLPLTGERELDRIVAALNGLSGRFEEARNRSQQLTRVLAQSDRLAVIGRTAAGLAHEIRNPLATIRLKAENALAAPGPRATEALQAILLQVERLDALLKNLLTLSKPIHPELQEVEVALWLEERLDQLRDQAWQAGVQLQVRIQPSDLRWRFDPQWLARALDNLLLNALQHTPGPGSISIAVREADKRLQICVRDTGPGVPEDVRANIFEPFVTTRAEGTGLGLALVREIAEAHGGTVRLSDNPAGAEFVLELP